MVEYKPRYNPADNAEVERIAKDMSKPELEDYYVKDRNKRHTKCGTVIETIIVVLLVIGFLGSLGYAIADDNLKNKVADNMEEISQKICPYLGEGYTSQEALHSSYDETRIVCDQTNSNWLGK